MQMFCSLQMVNRLCVCLYLSSICICMCVCIILGRSTPGADVVLGADGQQADASAYFVFVCTCLVFVFASVPASF